MQYLATLLSLLAAFAGLSTGLNDPGAACCPVEAASIPGYPICRYASGIVAGGVVWCYGYYPGDLEFSQDDLNVAKCLANLHYVQHDRCIDVAGSTCEGPSTNITKAYIEQTLHSGAIGYRPPFKHKPAKIETISADDSRAMQAAMQRAFEDQIRFTTNGVDFSAKEDAFTHAQVLLFGRADINGKLISALDFKYSTGGC